MRPHLQRIYIYRRSWSDNLLPYALYLIPEGPRINLHHDPRVPHSRCPSLHPSPSKHSLYIVILYTFILLGPSISFSSKLLYPNLGTKWFANVQYLFNRLRGRFSDCSFPFLSLSTCDLPPAPTLHFHTSELVSQLSYTNLLTSRTQSAMVYNYNEFHSLPS